MATNLALRVVTLPSVSDDIRSDSAEAAVQTWVIFGIICEETFQWSSQLLAQKAVVGRDPKPRTHYQLLTSSAITLGAVHPKTNPATLSEVSEHA